MKKQEKQTSQEPEQAPPAQRAERSDEKPAETIDFAKLDLSIYKVEERIAPSETNVFDK